MTEPTKKRNRHPNRTVVTLTLGQLNDLIAVCTIMRGALTTETPAFADRLAVIVDKLQDARTRIEKKENRL